MRQTSPVEKLFIDIEFVINAETNTCIIELPAGLCQKIKHYQTQHPALMVSILYDDNNVTSTPSPTSEHKTTLQFPNGATLETSAIKKMLLEKYSDFLNESLLTFHYLENLANHADKSALIITSNPMLQAIFQEADVETIDRESLQKEEKRNTQLKKKPHQLNPTHILNAKKVFHSASADQIIYIALDYDDTILRNDKSMMEKRYIVNHHLVEHLAELLNTKDSLENIRFMVVSARTEDCKLMPIEHGLKFFLKALNAKISLKHRKKITINDIFCMRRDIDTAKYIITALSNDGNVLDLWLTHTPHTPNYWLSKLSEEKKSIPHSIKIKFLRAYDEQNKSIFFNFYFFPLKKNLLKENFVVLMYDDNPNQVQAMQALNNDADSKGLLHCVKVVHPDECDSFELTPPSTPTILCSRNTLFAGPTHHQNPYIKDFVGEEVVVPLETPEPLTRNLSDAPLTL